MVMRVARSVIYISSMVLLTVSFLSGGIWALTAVVASAGLAAAVLIDVEAT